VFCFAGIFTGGCFGLGDVRLDGSSSIRPKGASGPVLVSPCVKLVG
jgi:hypothetical protein